jgi:2-alkyl-3-oxoalkanoate reductase
VKLTVVRPANVYGPGSGPWLHDIIAVIESGMPALVSRGDNNAGLAYVDNVADLLILAGSTAAALGRAYNACDGLDVTWRGYVFDITRIMEAKRPLGIPYAIARVAATFYEFIWKALGIKKRPPITREALNLVGSDNRFPAARARDELGFSPKVTYAEGIAEIEKYIHNYMQNK